MGHIKNASLCSKTHFKHNYWNEKVLGVGVTIWRFTVPNALSLCTQQRSLRYALMLVIIGSITARVGGRHFDGESAATLSFRLAVLFAIAHYPHKSHCSVENFVLSFSAICSNSLNSVSAIALETIIALNFSSQKMLKLYIDLRAVLFIVASILKLRY